MSATVIRGKVYVLGDNIDTDQIIPAQYLNLVPTIAEEYLKLGSHAFSGLPDSQYPIRYVKAGQLDSEYHIVVAGKNFGCGSSREHAPIALGSAGCKVILAESFARIFFRNCVATGELYPCECVDRLCHRFEAEILGSDVAGKQQRAPALMLDNALRFVRVIMLAQIDHRDIRAFAHIERGNRAADSAIGAGDQGDLAA